MLWTFVRFLAATIFPLPTRPRFPDEEQILCPGVQLGCLLLTVTSAVASPVTWLGPFGEGPIVTHCQDSVVDRGSYIPGPFVEASGLYAESWIVAT